VVSKLLPRHDALPGEELVKVKLKQGRGVWGVDLKIVDDDGQPQPWDGKAYGHLRVRGPWIASGYFKGEGGSPVDEEGFFTTGDVATIDADGFLQLVDRALAGATAAAGGAARRPERQPRVHARIPVHAHRQMVAARRCAPGGRAAAYGDGETAQDQAP
jgi:acyl-CoA synthetase (AMP-forming)/AMP-acid ligase II